MNVERSKLMDPYNIVMIIFAIMLGIIGVALNIDSPLEKRHQEKARLEASREAQEEIMYYLRREVSEVFGVELDTVHESTAQDEIVRIVNLLAHETSKACVSEDKYRRSKIEDEH